MESSSPVYGAGRAPFNPNRLSVAEQNMVEQACEERAREEAEANAPRFAEFLASNRIDMADVSALVSYTLQGNDESYMYAYSCAERLAGDWIRYRVGTMPQWERDEIEEKVLR